MGNTMFRTFNMKDILYTYLLAKRTIASLLPPTSLPQLFPEAQLLTKAKPMEIVVQTDLLKCQFTKNVPFTNLIDFTVTCNVFWVVDLFQWYIFSFKIFHDVRNRDSIFGNVIHQRMQRFWKIKNGNDMWLFLSASDVKKKKKIMNVVLLRNKNLKNKKSKIKWHYQQIVDFWTASCSVFSKHNHSLQDALYRDSLIGQ